jgi:hypothetical protein
MPLRLFRLSQFGTKSRLQHRHTSGLILAMKLKRLENGSAIQVHPLHFTVRSLWKNPGAMLALLVVSALTVAACYDIKVPDPEDTTYILWSNPCSSADCQGNPSPGSCGGTHRDQRTLCGLSEEETNEFCTSQNTNVKLWFFTGTCKTHNGACICVDKVDLFSTDYYQMMCKCIPCSAG